MSEEVLGRARALLERHPLRAGDAIQLASAMSLTEIGGLRFACFDSRLTRAARTEGLRVVP